VLADGGLISKKIAYSLPLRSNWENKHTKQIEKELIRNKLFLTNIVKCCYNHSNYPDTKVIDNQLKFLKEEIRMVKPRNIIAFGRLVYKTLTRLNISAIPCYFPIGRGNPKKSAEMMRKILRTKK
jgi:uracil-DNA glycosylase